MISFFVHAYCNLSVSSIKHPGNRFFSRISEPPQRPHGAGPGGRLRGVRLDEPLVRRGGLLPRGFEVLEAGVGRPLGRLRPLGPRGGSASALLGLWTPRLLFDLRSPRREPLFYRPPFPSNACLSSHTCGRSIRSQSLSGKLVDLVTGCVNIMSRLIFFWSLEPNECLFERAVKYFNADYRI